MKNFVKLLENLDSGGAKVTFRKLDGSRRVMTCTWGDQGDCTDSYARVWDVENRGYRTVRADSIISVK